MAAKESWADMTEDDPPQGSQDPAVKASDVAKLLEKSQLGEHGTDDVDEPDLSLKVPGLREVEAEVQVSTTDEGDIYRAAERFEDLGLSPELLQGIYQEMKFERPSKIQAKTLPMILRPPFRSMIAQAHNGSGKTTCFALAMLSRVDPKMRVPQALCMCPTRELVVQNVRVVAQMGKHTSIQIASTADTVGRRYDAISDQIVIGTHGTIKNWMGRNRILPVDGMRILVFDEADEMLARDGFGDDSMRLINDIRRRVPDVQILLFSATFDEKVKAFAVKVAPGANNVFIPREKLSLDVIKQYRVKCHGDKGKIQFLQDAFSLAQKLCQTIVFVKYKSAASQLAEALRKEGYSVTNISGDLEKEQRDRVVEEFREGKTKVLIATDVLARGFDLETISLVINFHVPTDRQGSKVDFETYLHRIGRSGRFGRRGCAFNLYADDVERSRLDEIERHFNHDIQEIAYDNEEMLEQILKEAGI